jgi:hypothetical protein
MRRSQDLEAALRPKRRLMTIIWAALLASVGLYVIVAYVASPSPEEVGEVPDATALGLTIAAVAAGAASLILPSRLLPKARLREHMQAENLDLARHARNPQTGKVDSAQLERLQRLPVDEQRLVTATSFFFTPWIVGAALAEAVTIFGLVLAFLTGQAGSVLPFAGASAVLLAMMRPRFEAYFLRLERLAR